ncbi:MAG: hypothetical protein RL757_1105 [Bacteroidota bacterium]|jgi:uncharacterized protein (DUF1697 family)
MKKYIAFLRGINVGNIRIKMADLKNAFEQLDCQEVSTYLQTGNVVFQSEQNAAELKIVLEKSLSQKFDYEAFVLIFDFNFLKKAIESYPFEKQETHHDYVIFVETEPILTDLKTVAQNMGDETQRIAFGENVVYWKVEKGESTNTAFAKTIAKAKYKSVTTTRNLNTLEKME